MPFDTHTLAADGFTGFRSFAQLDLGEIPPGPGIYAVLMPEGFSQRFLARSAGGHFKGKDPSLPEPTLAAEWVEGADVLYIGKAGTGKTGKRGLRKRIQEFADSQSLVIAWRVLPPEEVDAAEARYHAVFRAAHGRLPFANLIQARTSAG